MATDDPTAPRAAANTTRRSLFGAIPAALTLGTLPAIASTAAHPDAELLAVCAEFDRLEAHMLTLYVGGANAIQSDRERDAVIEPLSRTQGELAERAADIEAKTLAGVVAKARSAAAYYPDIMRGGVGNTEELLIASLFNDLFRGTVA